MSVSINLKNIMKRYGNNTVISNLDMSIKSGEFFTLLGPSGCGKTTLLRMIAGFNSIEGGEILFNDKVINNTPPHQRNIGMVFQNYAIFPHMSSKKNVAYGLKNKKVKNPELSRKIENVLSTMKIEHLKDRMPSEMSGGQQQRLALARAIVIEPEVLLMDEPLSNLDAQLRLEMREVIKDIQQKIKTSTIYVTHDQEEALAISDRIAVLQDGIIQQIGTPVEIFLYPKNLFVASFIGQSIFIEAETTNIKPKSIILNSGSIIPIKNMKKTIEDNKKVKLLVRPNEFIISHDEGDLKGKIIESFFLGVNIQYKIELENGETIKILDNDLSKNILKNNTTVYLKINPHIYNIFDPETEESLMDWVSIDE